MQRNAKQPFWASPGIKASSNLDKAYCEPLGYTRIQDFVETEIVQSASSLMSMCSPNTSTGVKMRLVSLHEIIALGCIHYFEVMAGAK